MEMVNKTIGDKIEERVPELYILSVGKEETNMALEIAERLRELDVFVERDIAQRSFKAQMKYADKTKAKNLVVIGENELNSGYVKLKNMETGQEEEIKLDYKEIYNKIIK